MCKSTPLDAVVEAHIEALAVSDPLETAGIGLLGHDHKLPGYFLGGTGRWADEPRRTLRLVEEAPRADAINGVIATAMTERLDLELESVKTSDQLAAVNNISSPVQWLWDVLDLMPTGTDEDWNNIASRLAGMPRAVSDYAETVRKDAARGIVPACRAVTDVAAQTIALVGEKSRFYQLVAGSGREGILSAELQRAVELTHSVFEGLTRFLA